MVATRPLRVSICGAVDDGKSTLISRLLREAKALFGGPLDNSLPLDGPAAECEQGVAIDVAYCTFSTAQRKFIVADAPGQEQCTRDMLTSASTADLVVLLVDASKGLPLQARRHAMLVSLIGVRHVVLAVNKMDLVDCAPSVFERIRGDFATFAARIGIEEVVAIPLSGLSGDNLAHRSARMPWYDGPTLMSHLDSVPIDEQRLQRLPFRMPVQRVSRPGADGLGCVGTVAAGTVAPGDRIRILPSGREATVARIFNADGDLAQAVAHQPATLTLADDVDVSRGDLLCSVDAPAAVADRFEATIAWLDRQPMLRGRSYWMKIAERTVTATVNPLKYKVNVETLEHAAATTLALDEIGVASLELDRPIAYDPYAHNRDTGDFILIDKQSNATVGAGMLKFALRRSDNIHRQDTEVDKAARRALNRHRSAVLWLTGLSGAGKSSLANLLEKRLHALGKRTYLLDGDNVRLGLNKDLGFTAADRVENVRRVAEVAKLMVDAGLIVMAALISPFRAERAMARELFEPGEFIEIFVDTPLSVAEARDPKGLYRKARRGELSNFTGIDSPYEAPEAPEVRVDTSSMTVEEAADRVFSYLVDLGLLDAP